MKEKILKSKCKLYEPLLQIPVEELTDNEIEIMYILSKDNQIQKKLEKSVY